MFQFCHSVFLFLAARSISPIQAETRTWGRLALWKSALSMDEIVAHFRNIVKSEIFLEMMFSRFFLLTDATEWCASRAHKYA
jgi:hypothetical protein